MWVTLGALLPLAYIGAILAIPHSPYGTVIVSESKYQLEQVLIERSFPELDLKVGRITNEDMVVEIHLKRPFNTPFSIAYLQSEDGRKSLLGKIDQPGLYQFKTLDLGNMLVVTDELQGIVLFSETVQ